MISISLHMASHTKVPRESLSKFVKRGQNRCHLPQGACAFLEFFWFGSKLLLRSFIKETAPYFYEFK